MLAVLLFACQGREPRDTAVDGGEGCEPFAIAPWQTWEEDELPKVSDVAGTIPGGAAGDFNGDGAVDVLVAYGGGAFMLTNGGAGSLFIDETFVVDGFPPDGATVAAVEDVDLDGDLDALLGKPQGRPDSIISNTGAGEFVARYLSDSEGTPGSAAFGDLDGDGDDDLVISGFVDSLDMYSVASGTQTATPTRVYLNDGGEFSVQLDAIPSVLDAALCYQALLVDIDLDSDLDIYMANDQAPAWPTNQLLLNDGAAHFSMGDDGIGVNLPMAAMGAAAGDVNLDGRPDFYVSDFGPPTLLLSSAGGYYDGTAAMNAAVPATEDHTTGWGTAIADLDRDGDNDMVITYGQSCGDCEYFHDSEVQYSQILLAQANGTFARSEPYTPGFEESGRTRSLFLADLDADGRQDLITVGKHFVRTWRVSGGCETGLTLTLVGDSAFPTVVGARVDVTVADRVQTRWMLPATAHSSSERRVTVGLGGQPAADAVRITWPDGAVTDYGSLSAGEHELFR